MDQILNGIIFLGLLTGPFLILRTLWCTARCCHGRCCRANEDPAPEDEPNEEDEILSQEVEQEDEIFGAENEPDENRGGAGATAQPPAPVPPPRRDYRPPAPEPQPVDQEPASQHPVSQQPREAPAAAAPSPVPPQRMRRRNSGGKQIPLRDPGYMYYAPTRRTAHLSRDCSGLASIPDADPAGADLPVLQRQLAGRSSHDQGAQKHLGTGRCFEDSSFAPPLLHNAL